MNTWEYLKWVPSNWDKRKCKVRIPQKNKKIFGNLILRQKSNQRNKLLGNLFFVRSSRRERNSDRRTIEQGKLMTINKSKPKTREELRRTIELGKLMTMNKSKHPKDVTDKYYVKKRRRKKIRHLWGLHRYINSGIRRIDKKKVKVKEKIIMIITK